MDDDTRGKLTRIATAARRFLEPHWAEWAATDDRGPDVPLSRGTCGRSSQFLVHVLRDAGWGAEYACGAPGRHDFGLRAQGRWYGHAWAECAGFIVDITADQFGCPPVTVTSLGDPAYRAGVDTADVQFAVARRDVAAALFDLWQGTARAALPGPPSVVQREDAI